MHACVCVSVPVREGVCWRPAMKKILHLNLICYKVPHVHCKKPSLTNIESASVQVKQCNKKYHSLVGSNVKRKTQIVLDFSFYITGIRISNM